MIRILLSGCNGKMGHAISNLVSIHDDIHIVAGVSPSGTVYFTYPVYKNISSCIEDFDLIVDFSVSDHLDELLTFALDNNKPALIGTTGHTDSQMAKIKAASNKIPVFFSPNTSLGISLLLDAVKRIVPILDDSFDIEIVEKHHNQKIDAPSGTALAIAKAVCEVSPNHELIFDRHGKNTKRSKNEIGIHSIRGGTYPGEHTIIFAGNDEFLEITHSAVSKSVFAQGAIRAIKFIIRKPIGLYTMEDLLKE